MTAGAGGPVEPLVVECPLCRVEPEPSTLQCPRCRESLAPLVHLAHAGRLHYNAALFHARAGDLAAARTRAALALEHEPDLTAAAELLAALEEGGRAERDDLGPHGTVARCEPSG